MTRIEVKALPSLRGRAAWNAILPKPPQTAILKGDITADVAIIGAGFAGLSAARRLLQIDPRLDVVVLDAMEIAESSAGRNSGFMIDLPHVLTSGDYQGAQDSDELTKLNRQAIAFGVEAVEEYGINPDYFDRCGKINGAVSAHADANNRAYSQRLAAKGEAFEWLDAKSMHNITGSHHYCSGLYTPGTTVLQPAGYIRGLAQGLAKQAQIFASSPVLRMENQGARWLLQTPQGAVSAANVILANNGHLESFGFAKGKLMQVFLYASMTEELGSDALQKLGGIPRWGVTPSDPMGTTIRRIDTPLGGHRIVTRSLASLRSNLRITEGDIKRAARIHVQKFAKRFPQIKDVRQEYQWAGHLCLSRNDVSVVREVEKGVFSACVQNGLGTARGTLTGMAAAEMLMGVQSEITAYFQAEAEPKKLPPQPFRDIGGNAIIRWQEWRARED